MMINDSDELLNLETKIEETDNIWSPIELGSQTPLLV